MIEPLQWLTAQYTTELVRLSGVPVHLDGWFMTIPGGTFHVAEACAGVRYLLACLAFGLLVCDLFFRRAWKVVAYVALTFAVPVVANVLRAYGIVMLAHLSDFEIAVGVDHLIYGYVFLSLVTVILIGIALAMRDPEARRRDFTDALGEPEAKKPSVGGRRAVALVALLVLLGGVRGYAYTVAPPADGASEVDLLAPTSEGTNWRVLPDQPSDSAALPCGRRPGPLAHRPGRS
jgi:exosortase/archaeosortase family protein